MLSLSGPLALEALENFKLLSTLGNFEALWCGNCERDVPVGFFDPEP